MYVQLEISDFIIISFAVLKNKRDNDRKNRLHTSPIYYF